jgi:tetratricopeptide (TPR) repeat protein
MRDGAAGAMRARLEALQARLGAPTHPDAERDALKNDIVALFKDVEAELTALAGLREDVKRAAERWRAIRDAARAGAPLHPPSELAPAAPQVALPPVVADHLNASTFVDKGWSRIAAGDHVGAEAVLVRALELAPSDAQAESLLGWAQMLQEKYDDALLHFHRVLARDPNNALSRINVGYICLKKRIFGEAIEHLSKALRLDIDRKASLYAHYYLGLVYLEREMYDDAETFFRRTLELGPNLVEAYYELGRALWFGGDRARAMEAWRDGRAANKFNPWGKRCADVLQTVEGGGEPPRVGL